VTAPTTSPDDALPAIFDTRYAEPLTLLAPAAKAIEALQAEVERLAARNLELNRLSYGWMVAHDMLKAGKPYDLPTPPEGEG
jgi:hypothetical protein